MGLNCLGNEVESGCVVYTGPDIASLGIRSGDSLDDVILKITNASGAELSTPTPEGLTSDDITSKALLRSTGSILSANIVKRDFVYSLQSTASGHTLLTWDLIPVIHQLPAGYEAVLTRVNVSGKPTSTSAVVANSKSPSANLNIPVDRYPISVDFTVRVTTPDSGNIDLTNTLEIINPAFTGSYRAVLDAKDLNPQSGQISLTDHLKSLESQVHNLAIKQESTPNLSTDLEAQKLAVEEVQSSLQNPSSLAVSYVQDGSNKSGEIQTIISDLYAQIKTLKDKDSSQQTELLNLRNQIDSATAS